MEENINKTGIGVKGAIEININSYGFDIQMG